MALLTLWKTWFKHLFTKVNRGLNQNLLQWRQNQRVHSQFKVLLYSFGASTPPNLQKSEIWNFYQNDTSPHSTSVSTFLLALWDGIPFRRAELKATRLHLKNRSGTVTCRGGARQLGEFLELLEVENMWHDWARHPMPSDIHFFANIFRIKIFTSWHDQLNTYHHNSQQVVNMNSFFSCS